MDGPADDRTVIDKCWDIRLVEPESTRLLADDPRRTQNIKVMTRPPQSDRPGLPTEMLRELGDDFQLFALQPFLTSTRRRNTQQRHRLIALVLAHFLQDHGLTTRVILRPQLPLPDDFVIRVGDLTERGLAFYRQAEQEWLRSIDRGKSPTDTTILADVLRTIRRQN